MRVSALTSWWHGSGMFTSKLVWGGSKVRPLLHHLSLDKLFACRTGCSELPEHNTQLCMSGLEASCPSYFHTVLNKAGTHWAIEHHWGGLICTNVGVIVIFPPRTHSFPLPLWASSIVPECHGLSREAGLSTGIYEQRNKLEPYDWKHSLPLLFILYV